MNTTILQTLYWIPSHGKGGHQERKHKRTGGTDYSIWKYKRKIVSLGCKMKKVKS